MAYWKWSSSKVWLVIPAVFLALLAVACGGAAKPAPAPQAAPQPAAPPTPVGVAAPIPTPIPVAQVSPGKVTWMTGNLGNERFDATYSLDAGGDYGRQLHAYFISSDVKDGKRVMVPGIASEWAVSSDGLTWTLTIRKGVKFHDGTEVTVEDALWSLRHSMSPQVKEYAISTAALKWAAIMDRIEQTGPNRISIITKTPAPEFLTIALAEPGSGAWFGVAMPKRATLHDEKEAAAYDLNPIGAGILRLLKHVPADSMSFERFADHYYQPKNGLPTDKRVNFTLFDLRLVPEEATRVAALRAGGADIAPVSLPTRKQVEAGGGRLVFGQEGVYFEGRQYGCWKPQFPCNDRRVRQALNYAIDKQVIRDRLYGGPEVMQVRGWGAVTPSAIGYTPALDPWRFDPAKARQLLAEAGYPGGKGFGKLVINTWTSTALPLMPESAQLAADFWRRELGLDVEVKVGDEAGVKKAIKFGEELHGQIVWRDNETRLDALGSLFSNHGSPGRPDNLHNDPQLFELMEQTRTVFEPVAREKHLDTTFRQLREEAYLISVGYLNIPWGVGPRILTWQPYPLAVYPSALHTITVK